MADDKSKVGEPDRSRVAAAEDYEVQYVANKYGITPEQVRELIAKWGNDRTRVEREAARLHELSA
jgi:hypothetical protein